MSEQSHERRIYSRATHLGVHVSILGDFGQREDVEADDLSSGGIQIRTERNYDIGDELFLSVKIKTYYSEFDIKVKGIIRRKSQSDIYCYGVQFVDLDDETMIRIDECAHFKTPFGNLSESKSKDNEN